MEVSISSHSYLEAGRLDGDAGALDEIKDEPGEEEGSPGQLDQVRLEPGLRVLVTPVQPRK